MMFGWKKKYGDTVKELKKTKEILEKLQKMYSDLLENYIHTDHAYQILCAAVNKDKEKRSKAAKKAAEARWHNTEETHE